MCIWNRNASATNTNKPSFGLTIQWIPVVRILLHANTKHQNTLIMEAFTNISIELLGSKSKYVCYYHCDARMENLTHSEYQFIEMYSMVTLINNKSNFVSFNSIEKNVTKCNNYQLCDCARERVVWVLVNSFRRINSMEAYYFNLISLIFFSLAISNLVMCDRFYFYCFD